MRTRLEYIIRSKHLKPSALARRAGYSRQHLVRMREGLPSSARSESAVVEAVSEQLQAPIEHSTLFEPRTPTFIPLGDVEHLDKRDFDWSIAQARNAFGSERGIRALLDSGEALLDRNPRRAETLYSLASELVAKLPSTPAPLAHSLHGLAQKGRANALRMSGRYEEALDALVGSEHEFEVARYCRRELGYARYCRATVLFKMERWTEADRAVQGARSLLDAEHDRSGVINCDILRACIALERGELDRAREMFVGLRKMVEGRRDYRRLADLWMNLVICDLRRGDTFGAGHWLGRAVRKYRELGLASEIARARWSGATLALVQGQRARALRELRTASEEFEALGMPMDAAFVKLDLLGELVEEKKWREAEPIALSLADLFLKARVGPSAATALDYLRDTVKQRSADRAVVSRVERHIRRAEVFPAEVFTKGPA